MKGFEDYVGGGLRGRCGWRLVGFLWIDGREGGENGFLIGIAFGGFGDYIYRILREMGCWDLRGEGRG